MITQERLRELVKYDEVTGLFTWNKQRPKCVIGCVAGRIGVYGYIQIRIEGKTYTAHRLAFLYVTGSFPVNQVDHINGVKNDNRWSNLRAATHYQNQCNRLPQGNNTSGVPGVYFERSVNKWTAAVKANGKLHFLGRFSNKEDAVHAVRVARPKLHGDFARLAA
jgi:hypothetical protein